MRRRSETRKEYELGGKWREMSGLMCNEKLPITNSGVYNCNKAGYDLYE